MDRAAFAQMAAAEATHWWFVGRRAVIDALIDGIDLPESGEILEAGCGTGGNLASLARRGRIAAFEPQLDAIEFAKAKHPDVEIRTGSLPEDLPYPVATFDLVAALDVLEHVEDDQGAAHALARMVKPGGWLLVTVPAHQALWGSHDKRLYHVRRYGRKQLLALFDDCELEVVRWTAFNLVLAPLAVVYRIFEARLGRDLGSQERVPPRPLNALLSALFRAEAFPVRHGMRIPFGISYAVLLRRPG
jgi:SAM-dependent methyltransferase